MINSTLPDLSPLSRSTLSIADLDLLSEAFRHGAEALRGFQNQPRATTGDRLTPAGEIVAQMVDWLSEHADALAASASQVLPADAAQAQAKAWVLLRRAVLQGDDLHGVAVMAATALAEVRDADYADRNLRRPA